MVDLDAAAVLGVLSEGASLQNPRSHREGHRRHLGLLGLLLGLRRPLEVEEAGRVEGRAHRH